MSSSRPLLLVLPAGNWASLPATFRAAAATLPSKGQRKVLVHVLPLAGDRWPPLPQDDTTPLGRRIQSIKRLYGSSAGFPHLDCRVLMHGVKPSLPVLPPKPIGDVSEILFGTVGEPVKEGYLKSFQEIQKTEPQATALDLSSAKENNNDLGDTAASDATFDEIALGGTFDRIHAGHKILLAESLLRTRRRMVVGVTQKEMLKKKTLPELILPLKTRLSDLREFLTCCDPGLEYSLVGLTDPFGPAIHEPQLEAIVASEETKRGCEMINDIRVKEKGMAALEVFLVGLEKDPVKETEGEEDKVSSSSFRRRMLGHLLRPPLKEPTPSSPYIIGLCGGSASGKSSVAKRFAALGAHIIDCDALGHRAYEPGSECYSKVVAEFGTGVLVGGEMGAKIDRAALGKIIFSDPANKARLEQLVWPEILSMAMAEISSLDASTVVILDAAVLLMADWHTRVCHQVWACVLDRGEAVRRIVERDGKSEEEAARRLDSQWENEKVVSEANVVFCTQWEPEETQRQVEKAWRELQGMMLREQNGGAKN